MIAFEDQLTTNVNKLHEWALKLTRDSNDASDLVQDTLCKALEKRAYFRLGSDMRAWLFTIAYNLFVSGRRRRAVYATVYATLLLEDRWSPPNQETAASLADAAKAMKTLPGYQRDLLWRITFHDLDYARAAAQSDVAVGTIKSRLGRAREVIREAAEL